MRRREDVVPAEDLAASLARAAEPEAPVRPAVVADLVPAPDDGPHDVGRPPGALADQEEGSADLMPGQQIEHDRRPARVGAVVERQGQLAPACRTPLDACAGTQMWEPRVTDPDPQGADSKGAGDSRPHRVEARSRTRSTM